VGMGPISRCVMKSRASSWCLDVAVRLLNLDTIIHTSVTYCSRGVLTRLSPTTRCSPVPLFNPE
jgi:hypothetical protein